MSQPSILVDSAIETLRYQFDAADDLKVLLQSNGGIQPHRQDKWSLALGGMRAEQPHSSISN